VIRNMDSDSDSDNMTEEQKKEWHRLHNERMNAWQQEQKARKGKKTPRWKKELIRKGKAWARRGMLEGYYGEIFYLFDLRNEDGIGADWNRSE